MACIIGMVSGCGDIIRDMYDKCKGGFSKYIGKCSVVKGKNEKFMKG